MVKVKTVVTLAAEMLGAKERVERYVNGTGDSEDQRIADALVSCYNLVETEIATDRVPIVVEEKLEAYENFIYYTDFSETPAFILSVCDRFGCEAEAKIGAKAIEVPKGLYTVRYAKIPSEKSMDDNSELLMNVSARTLAYGVAAEYCLHTGAYAEHAVWEKKYRESLAVDTRSRRAKFVKGRKWV